MKILKNRIKSINDIPETEAGDLLFMAIGHISSTSRKSKTPNEIIEELQKKRIDLMYTEKNRLDVPRT